MRRSSHFAFPVLLADREARDAFRDRLKDQGVQTTWYPALHRFTGWEELAPDGGLPGCEQAAERHCAIPLTSTMDEQATDTVVTAVCNAVRDA